MGAALWAADIEAKNTSMRVQDAFSKYGESLITIDTSYLDKVGSV